MTAVQKITLVDRGQDFLEWYVREGIVIDCQPFQGQVWVGAQLQFPEGPLQVGGLVHVQRRNSDRLTILNYPILSIDVLSDADAADTEDVGRGWVDILGLSDSDLGL